jgi:hypothetical protein
VPRAVKDDLRARGAVLVELNASTIEAAGFGMK